MIVEELLDRLDALDDGLENEPPLAGIRLRATRDIAREVTRAALELADATNEHERALLARLRHQPADEPAVVRIKHRVTALRQQAQWARALDLAELVCLLLNEAMGGGPVSSDTAGVSASDDERRRIEWLTKEGWRVRRGTGTRNSARNSGTSLKGA